jgi:hypothetical protein
MRRGEYGRESPSSWSAVGSRLVPPRLHQKYAHAQYNNNKVELASILTGRARRFVEGGKLPPTGVALKVGPPRPSLFEIYPVNRGTPMPTWGGDCASTADPFGSLAGFCSWTGQQQGARRRGRVPASVPLAKGKLALQKKKKHIVYLHAISRRWPRGICMSIYPHALIAACPLACPPARSPSTPERQRGVTRPIYFPFPYDFLKTSAHKAMEVADASEH